MKKLKGRFVNHFKIKMDVSESFCHLLHSVWALMFGMSILLFTRDLLTTLTTICRSQDELEGTHQ